MDKYLGTIMTVVRSNEWRACMEEDNGRWSWNKFTIAEVVDDSEPATQEELLTLLMG